MKIEQFWDDAIVPTLVEYIKIPAKSPHFDKAWEKNGYIEAAVRLADEWCRKHAIPEDGVAMAVVVQRMVDAMCAGVMFTRSPLTGDKSVITIEGAWGLGSAVVSGEVTPDRWVLGKITGEISVRDISDKHARQVPKAGGGIHEVENEAAIATLPCLTDDQLMALREVGRRIERHYGKPQDIEWALDQDGNVLLLQSRPETVWSARDAAPVTKPTDNPLAHVMNIFGGRK